MASNNLRREMRDIIEKTLIEQGVTVFEFSTRNSHPCVLFNIEKQPRFYVFAGSTGDRRAVMNTRTSLKRFIREEGDRIRATAAKLAKVDLAVARDMKRA